MSFFISKGAISQATAKNPLLAQIKTAIATVFPIQPNTGAVMTDELRRDILDILISFSEQIPHPASGSGDFGSQTLIRWQILAFVAGLDLTIAKWFESHLDALSILKEVGDIKAQGLWAVWAAEGHPDPIRFENGNIFGNKAWCSGANIVDFGLLTYRDEAGQSQLIMVDMAQSGIDIDNGAWQAVGMQATDTATIQFHGTPASLVGSPNAYLDRVGFWHGAAGVAACWFGATTAIADYLLTSVAKKPNHFKAMYLGQIATALAVNQQYFYHVANLIDTIPDSNHELAIRQLRANTEQVARQVLETVGQALGAAPFCTQAHFAKLSADLTVFIRQSHGAFDWQRIGELAAQNEELNSNTSQERLWQL